MCPVMQRLICAFVILSCGFVMSMVMVCSTVPFRSPALDNGGGNLSSFSSPAPGAAHVMTSQQVFVSPAGTKRVYSRDELMKMKDFRSSKIVHSIMQHMPDNLRQGEMIERCW